MTRIGLVFLLGALAMACASTSKTIHGLGFSYQTKSDVKPVGDVPGHVAGSWENRGICLDNAGQKDEEVGVLMASGTFDAVFTSTTTTTSCTSKGRATCIFKDGSFHTDETTAECKFGPNGFLIFEARGMFVQGTGRFEGIQGPVSGTSWSMSPPPENLGFSKVHGEGTLPKK